LIAGVLLALSGWGLSEEMGADQERDYLEGKIALDAARKAWAEKYAPGPWTKAKDLLDAAAEARSGKDWIKFAQASRLARAYAELAKTEAELKMEEEELTALREELRKAKEELDLLKRSAP
jgi:hypothetical protein